MSPGALKVLRFSVIGMGVAILVLATVFALQLWRVVREAGSNASPVAATPQEAPPGPVVGRAEPADLGLAPGTRILSVAAVGDGRVVLLVEASDGEQSLLLVEPGALQDRSNEE